jgi:hypothetical protein
MSLVSAGSIGLLKNIDPKFMTKLPHDIGPVTPPQAPPQSAVRADNAPENLFAKITRNGQLIAKVYNSGLVESPAGFPDLSLDGSGLALAKKRIAEIVKATGGEVAYQSGMKAGGVNAGLLFQAQLASSDRA